MTGLREAAIEAYLRRRVIDDLGGICAKWTGIDGNPDRIVILPGGETWFIETKAPGKQLESLQIVWRNDLQLLGHNHAMLDTKSAVDAWVAQRMKERYERNMGA